MAFSLKDYELLEEIGHGGFATVFKARQKSLSRDVAIKRLSPQHMQNSSEIMRFRREAEAMAALTHDAIIAVFDYAFYNGNYYIVMEYIDGMSFDKALEKGVGRQSALFALEKVAGALKFAHARNIIHRDIKPANVLLGKNGQVKLADFGLALFQTGIESFTSPGSVLGTISYMAPEALVSPREVDARVDVFSLGCILYRVCSGSLPFTGAAFGEISFKLLNEEPSPIEAAGLPEGFAGLIMRCLHKDREKRPSVAEVHDGLIGAVRDSYHSAHEELAGFVRQEKPGPSIIDKSYRMAEAITAAGILKSKRRPVPAIVAAVLAVVALTTVAMFFTMESRVKSRSSSLPSLPAMDLPVTNESAPESGTGTMKRTYAVPADAPLPMTGSPADLQSGIIVRGISPQDTIMVNGREMSGARNDSKAELELPPGNYRLEVRRSNVPAAKRDIDLIPFERQVVDIPQQGGTR